MNIEQRPPNKPNFPLIVVLFVVAILIVLLTAYFFVYHEARRMPDGKHVRVERTPQAPANVSIA